MGLSCCRRLTKFHQQHPGAVIRQKSAAVLSVLTQKRTLKPELKGRQRTLVVRKDCPQMFHRLQQRIGVCADRRRLFPAELRSHRSQALPQSAPQPIDGFQRERQPKFFSGGFEGKPRQHFHQPPPHQRGRQRVARQNVSQHEGKSFAAAATLPAIGAKYPPATNGSSVGLNRIVATQDAVPVQGFNLSAAGAALLFERKSRVFNSSLSRTK